MNETLTGVIYEEEQLVVLEQEDGILLERQLFPKLDGILFPIVIENADVVAACGWMGGAEVSLSVALNNYYQPMTEENADMVIADVYDFLSRQVCPDKCDGQSELAELEALTTTVTEEEKASEAVISAAPQPFQDKADTNARQVVGTDIMDGHRSAAFASSKRVPCEKQSPDRQKNNRQDDAKTPNKTRSDIVFVSHSDAVRDLSDAPPVQADDGETDAPVCSPDDLRNDEIGSDDRIDVPLVEANSKEVVARIEGEASNVAAETIPDAYPARQAEPIGSFNTLIADETHRVVMEQSPPTIIDVKDIRPPEHSEGLPEWSPAFSMADSDEKPQWTGQKEKRQEAPELDGTVPIEEGVLAPAHELSASDSDSRPITVGRDEWAVARTETSAAQNVIMTVDEAIEEGEVNGADSPDDVDCRGYYWYDPAVQRPLVLEPEDVRAWHGVRETSDSLMGIEDTRVDDEDHRVHRRTGSSTVRTTTKEAIMRVMAIGRSALRLQIDTQLVTGIR